MKRIRLIINYSAILVFVLCASSIAEAQKMDVGRVIQGHLEAIGTAENRAALKDMTASGIARYTILRTGGIRADGPVVVASDSNKMLLGMRFNSPNYTGDIIIFDGSKLKVGYTINNVRSYLGDFLNRYQEPVNRGLFSGALTTSWFMYDPTFRNSRIEYDGVKKIDGKEVYALSVLPKGGSNVDIQLFFEKDTFRHVRSVYKIVIGSIQGATVDTSSQRRGQRQTLIEDFSDFRNEKGLTLPHGYRLYVIYDGETDTKEFEWVMTFSEFLFNQKLDPNSFNTN